MQVASMHFKERRTSSCTTSSCRRTSSSSRASSSSAPESLSELDDFEATREAGRAIRDRALADLDVWLEMFERNATARGATVLFAETPADVNALVLEIAARHAVRKIIKSKSMVSEESALDHAIEAAGLHGRRDRPRRVHPADQRLRGAVAHHRAGAAQEQGRGRRPLPAKRTARRARPASRSSASRRAAGAARALPHRRHGHLRRQLLRRRDRVGGPRHQRGQRARYARRCRRCTSRSRASRRSCRRSRTWRR